MENQPFQHRLDLITSARVEKDANRFLQLQIETSSHLVSSSEIKYEFKETDAFDSTCFVGRTTDGAIVSCFMHDGTNNSNGGYSDQLFDLKMVDGTLRTIRGPWSGRPSVHRIFGSGEYLLAVNKTEHGCSVGLTEEFVKAILERFNLPFFTNVVPSGSNEYSLTLFPCEHPEVVRESYKWTLPSGGDQPDESGYDIDFVCTQCKNIVESEYH